MSRPRRNQASGRTSGTSPRAPRVLLARPGALRDNRSTSRPSPLATPFRLLPISPSGPGEPGRPEARLSPAAEEPGELPGWFRGETLEQLAQNGLGAWAYTRLKRSDQRQALRSAHLAAVLAHRQTRSRVIPLLRAWWEADIQTLLFKGFALSEFLYPVPGVRSYADVDVLLNPAQVESALRIARELGWWDRSNASRLRARHHTAFVLVGPRGVVRVDAHRWLLHSRHPWTGAHRNVTRSVLADAEKRTLEGVPVRIPSAVDSAVVGVILQRCWGDDWKLRPHHLLDLHLLRGEAGVTREAILGRAEALGCRRTVELFLRHHPGILDDAEADPQAARPTRWGRTAAVLLDRPDRVLAAPLGPVHAVTTAVREVPALVAALRATIATRRGARSALRPSTSHARTEAGSPEWSETAIRWALRLAGVPTDQVPHMRLRILRRMLGEAGWDVRMRRSEVCRWLELNGRIIAASHPLGPLGARRRGSEGPAR